MKFASVLLFSALAAASPIYQVEWVTLTKYTTILAGYDEYTSAFPQNANTQSPSQSTTPTSTAVATTVTSSVSPVAASEISTVSPTESSIVPVPTTSTIATTASPETTSTSSLTTTSSTSTTTSSTQASSSATGSVFSGDGTYYDTGLGACGVTNVDTDYIVAIGHGLFDQYTPNGNPNKNTLCGKKIIASYEGKSVEVTAVDRCEGCKPYDLDFSPAAFKQIADQALGRIKITWQWA